MLLTAFYDFDVAAYDYEFLCFLALADVARREAGCDGLHIVFVPETNKPPLADLYDADACRWRMNNILLPACRLLPSCQSITLCTQRRDAETIAVRAEAIYPVGYTVSGPVGQVLTPQLGVAASLGHDLLTLEAGEQARSYVQQWLARLPDGGQRAVTLSLRQAPYNPQRNSEPGAWSGFARQLTAEGYVPVVVPDTERALEPPESPFDQFPYFSEAAFNLELRAALYEEAYLNAFVANGVIWASGLSKRTRMILFLTGEWRTSFAERRMGVPVGQNYAHFNRHQKLKWGEQDADYFMREFRILSARIDADDAAEGRQPRGADPANREPTIQVAHRLLRHRLWSNLDPFLSRLRAADPDNGTLHALAGWAELNKGGQGDAAKGQTAFTRAVELLRPMLDTAWTDAEAKLYFEALDKLDRRREAETWLRAQLDNDANALAFGLLGRLLESEKRFAEAESCYRQAIALGNTDPGWLLGLGRALQARGAVAEAADYYRAAIATGEAEPECYQNLGFIYEAHDKAELAIDTYREAIRQERASFAGCYRLAMLLVERGAHAEAATIFTYFNKRGWTHPRIDAALAQIAGK